MRLRPLVQKLFEPVDPYATVVSVREQLINRSYVVVMDDTRYFGVLIPDDVVRSPHNVVIDCVRDKPRLTCDQSIEEALGVMRRTGDTVLPVFDGDVFFGVVLQSDITDHLLAYRAELERDVARYTNDLSRINDRLLAEIEERRRSEEQLAQSEMRYRELADLLPQPIYEARVDGRFLFVNQAARRTFGYTLGDVARGLTIADILAPEDQARGRRNFERRLRGEQFGGVEYTALRKNGTRLPVMIHSSAIYRDGAIVGVRGVVVDVAGVKRVRQKTSRPYGRFDESLVRGIIHDYNNILAGVTATVSLARSHPHARGELDEMLAQAERSAANASELTRQLLTLGGDAVKTKPISLRITIEDTVKVVLRGTQARAKLSVADDLWPAIADEAQFARVLSNVVRNAAEAMTGAGIVEVAAQNVHVPAANDLSLPAGPFVRIGVRDSGMGIASADLPKVFDSRFSTKRRGSGLGLSVSRHIMAMHNGAIDVSSTPGEGTTVALYLPACADSAKPAQVACAVSTCDEDDVKPRRALLLEDHETLRQATSMMLQRVEIVTDCASTGAEALALYRKALHEGNAYGLVIVDLVVPGGMDGRELLRRIRRIDPHVRALACSGSMDSSTCETLRQEGFLGVLKKPYTLEELDGAIRALTS